jgi:uncharacterized protein YndB with AHSA1/START domain
MDTIELTRVMKAPARRVFEAWLDPAEHALMTGAATSAGEDGAYTAWDGYIKGKTTRAEPFTRIEQTWRTNEFPEGHADSHLVVELTEVEGGTEVKLVHSELPAGQSERYRTGWIEYYLDPMEKYFQSPREKLKEGVEALEDAASRAGERLEEAVENAGAALETAAKNVSKALKSARTQAKGKQVRKKVAAQAKSLGKKVRALVKRKKTAKATTSRKPTKKRASASKKKTKKTSRRS